MMLMLKAGGERKMPSRLRRNTGRIDGDEEGTGMKNKNADERTRTAALKRES